MPLLARALCLVLAALAALAGVSVDLCACDGGGHGLFCAAPPAVAAPAGGCCGGEPAPALPGPGVHDDGDCACPEVAFHLPPVEREGPPPPLTVAADAAPAGPLLPALAAAPTRAPFVARAPPTTKLRRHLALHVLRL
ncbi:MAG: hypothetical protein M9894_26605 [Planctomycetes bacterium]|nr:hypothetical protein [Planctomycetota bacterium]